MTDSRPTEYPWQTVFMEATVRALRAVHYAHQPLSLGRPQEPGQGGWLDRMNTGYGVEFADERTVCGQILIELATNRITTGVHFPARPNTRPKGADAGRRSFEFDHEKHAELAGDDGEEKAGRVDLVFRRYDTDTPEKYGHVYIEAKRALRWRWNRNDGQPENPSKILTDEVKLDIAKLGSLRSTLPPDEEAFFHVLVWGYANMAPTGAKARENDARLSSPAAFLKGLCEHDGLKVCRWLPLLWRGEEGEEAFASPPVVDRWLWVALQEVHAPAPPPKS